MYPLWTLDSHPSFVRYKWIGPNHLITSRLSTSCLGSKDTLDRVQWQPGIDVKKSFVINVFIAKPFDVNRLWSVLISCSMQRSGFERQQLQFPRSYFWTYRDVARVYGTEANHCVSWGREDFVDKTDYLVPRRVVQVEKQHVGWGRIVSICCILLKKFEFTITTSLL